MDVLDRYAFAQAFLKGDTSARLILADLLEEQGDIGLAQWARGCWSNANRRLDLGIMLLPNLVAIRLAAEFIESASKNTQWEVAGARVIEAVDPWLKRMAAGAAAVGLGGLGTELHGLAAWAASEPTRNPFVRSRANPFTLALSHLHEASWHAYRAESPDTVKSSARHQRTHANQQVREVAAACRLFDRRRHSQVTDQLQKAVAAYEQLLTPQAASWPK